MNERTKITHDGVTNQDLEDIKEYERHLNKTASLGRKVLSAFAFGVIVMVATLIIGGIL